MSIAEPNRPTILTQAQRKVISDLIPSLVARLKLDHVNSRTINFTGDELEEIWRVVTKALVDAPTGMVRNSLSHVQLIVAQVMKVSDGIGSIPSAERIYQFRISLLESEPQIWRRIQVKRCSLDRLHEHIQSAFGWENCHLHQFEIDGVIYGDPDLLLEGFEDDPETEHSASTSIDDVIPRSGKQCRFEYLYDFGDGWKHEVLFEGCLRSEKGQRYPLCLEGARACPPEDVGGMPGYEDYLEALADTHHEQHEEMITWRGPFDPGLFHPDKTTRRMRRGLPDWRSME